MIKLLAIIVFAILVPSIAFAQTTPRIDDVTVLKDPRPSVSFVVKDAFTPEIDAAISSGIPTSFTYIIEVYGVDRLWVNEELGRWTFKHTVKYDNLREEYEVALGESGKTVRTKDATEMRAFMTTCGPVALNPPEPLVAGNAYELRVMAELKTVRLPFFMDYLLFFFRIWDFETRWHVHRFVL